MPIPLIVTLIGRVAINQIGKYAIKKGLPQAIKKYGNEAVKKAGQWAVKNPKDVGVKIVKKTRTISKEVRPKQFYLSKKEGKIVKRTGRFQEPKFKKVKQSKTEIYIGGKKVKTITQAGTGEERAIATHLKMAKFAQKFGKKVKGKKQKYYFKKGKPIFIKK